MFALLWYFSEPPSPPLNVKVNDITKKSCTVTWEPPESDGGSPVTGYLVERRNGRSAKWLKVGKDTVTECQMKLTDLMEKSEYSVRVSAVNAVGTSKPSQDSGVFVAKDAFGVPGKPGAPEVQQHNADSATITWKAPDSDGGTPITNYIVEMKVAGEAKWNVVNKGDVTLETTYTVKVSSSDKEVEFRVTAENKAGQGPASASTKSKYGKFFVMILIFVVIITRFRVVQRYLSCVRTTVVYLV